jgi:hypothetical protein
VNFLAPWYIPAIAAALTIPPLVLLYYLKLRRQEMPISSTLLWRKAVEDLRVNAPFQKMRKNLLLLLQLLILLAAILAIAEPIFEGGAIKSRSVVLIIDNSASMAAKEDDGRTRLEIAKDEATEVIDGLQGDQRAMIITFAQRARVLTPFTGDKDALRRAIETIEQTEAPGRLTEAVALAEAHASQAGEFGTQQEAVNRAQMLLLTDGRLADSEDVSVNTGELEVVRIGKRANNVGIVRLDVRRHYEQPSRLSVLALTRNFGSEPASRDVQLFVDGELKDVRPLVGIAPMAPEEELTVTDLSGLPPEGSVAGAAFELIMETAAEIEVRLTGDDAFDLDDHAYAVVAPPQPMTALLVTPGNRFLRQLMQAMPLASYEVISPGEYQNMPDEELLEDGRCRYDVVIFDGHSTERLPPGNYFFFGSVPLIDGVESGERVENEIFLDWDETHPLLQHVTVEQITVVSWLDLTMPDEARTLIEATNGPVLSLLSRGRNQYLVSAFGIFDESRTALNTTWVFQEGIVAFMYDALRFLVGNTTIGRQPSVQPGQPFTVAAKPDATRVSVRKPSGFEVEVPVRATGLVTFGDTDQVGIYRIGTGIEGEDARAVNLLDEAESFIAPNAQLRIASGNVDTGETEQLTRRPLWPYLLAAGAAVLFLEWFVYCRRVFV